MIQRHMESLRANTRRNEVDPDFLRWTPSTTHNAVLSEEEREAEMDVSFLVQSLVICLHLPATLLLDCCLISWRVQIEAINGESIITVSRHLMLCKIAPKSVHEIIDSAEYFHEMQSFHGECFLHDGRTANQDAALIIRRNLPVIHLSRC